MDPQIRAVTANLFMRRQGQGRFAHSHSRNRHLWRHKCRPLSCLTSGLPAEVNIWRAVPPRRDAKSVTASRSKPVASAGAQGRSKMRRAWVPSHTLRTDRRARRRANTYCACRCACSRRRPTASTERRCRTPPRCWCGRRWCRLRRGIPRIKTLQYIAQEQSSPAVNHTTAPRRPQTGTCATNAAALPTDTGTLPPPEQER